MDFDYTVMPIALVAVALVVDALCLRSFVRLSKRALTSGRKLARFVPALFAALLVSYVAYSSADNAVASHLFWAKHPPTGRFEAVNGHRMYLECTGSGSPTLVLDAGLGGDSASWAELQAGLSRTTRVCSYDRAGFGWSEAAPGPRDADAIANELHQLLQKAGVGGPFVLAGDSIAGLNIRDYAERYPSDVVGLVFVDSSAPSGGQNADPLVAKGTPPAWIFRLAMIAGVPRRMGMCSSAGSGAGAAFEAVRKEDLCRLHYGAYAAELQEFDASSREAERVRSFGALAVLIFSHDPLGRLPRQPQSSAEQTEQRAWDAMQESLKALSTRSRRIIVLGGTHQLDQERPGLVEKQFANFVEEIRGVAPQPTDSGTTVRE